MSDSTRHYVLTDWGALRASGPDAVSFLQGQLSSDVKQLGAARAVPAGLHNPQGRVLALAWLRRAPEGVWMMLPASLLATVATRLRRFVLRSKVTIDEVSSLHIVGSRGPGGRDLQVIEDLALSGAQADAHSAAEWRRLEIADGIPEVVPATSESFVAQMLNLDCIDAVSWDKGCYTGQEIIARAHYRGHVKRRMQRFGHAGVAPAAGSAHVTRDGISVQVVQSEPLPQGGSELLAVAPLEPRSRDSLPLPYVLPG
jgi:folate-binding protein YgfZ